MKRIDWPVLFCVAVLFWIVACLHAQGAFGQLPPGLIVKPVDPFVAILDGTTRVHNRNSTPESRADIVRWAVTQLKPGQALELAATDYNFGATPFKLPPGIKIVGQGKGKTTLISTQEDQRHYCGFEITGRGAVLEDLTLIWKSKDGLTRGGQTLGIADPTNPGNTNFRAKNIEVISYGSCALYYWGGGKGHKGTFVDCDFKAGRWGGCIGAGSGDDSAILDFTRCSFVADFATYGGAGGDMGTPSNTTAWVSRGGQCTQTDCVYDVTGFPGTGKVGDPNGPAFEWAIGATASSLGDRDRPKYPYKWPYLTLNNPKVTVRPNGARNSFDVEEYIGTVVIRGGSGSGPNGAWNNSPGVEYAIAP